MNQLQQVGKARAIGTAGEVGQLFTVYASNWQCGECRQENHAAKTRCMRCRKQKPATAANYVADPALSALQQGVENSWQEVIDPASNQIYYFNRSTNITQWERPTEMGAAPLATGWFGRGQAGSGAAQKYAQLNAHYLERPARKQKDFIDPKKYVAEGANEYNIWYGKYLGDREENNRDPATDRCKLELDAGHTKADTNVLNKSRKFFCLHFAHGMCAKGSDCPFYHRIPTPDDDARCDELFDCFGRSRHSKHRDDMKGTGSFMKPCRTLFVGQLAKPKYKTPELLEAALWRHFEEWGELENINVIHRLSIAFPRFRLRTSAEFAKEAMSNQTLDFDEVLTIRWAHDDPNPMAQDAISRADRDALAAILQAKGVNLTAAPFHYPAEYQMPAAKRLKSDGTEETGGLSYPDTDAQYAAMQQQYQQQQQHFQQYQQQLSAAAEQQGQGQQQMTPEQYQQYCETYYASYYAAAAAGGTGADPVSSSSSSSSSAYSAVAGHVVDVDANTDSFFASVLASSTNEAGMEKNGSQEEEDDEDDDDEEDDEDVAPNVWFRHQDPGTGAFYYFNKSSGSSLWGKEALPSDAEIRV